MGGEDPKTGRITGLVGALLAMLDTKDKILINIEDPYVVEEKDKVRSSLRGNRRTLAYKVITTHYSTVYVHVLYKTDKDGNLVDGDGKIIDKGDVENRVEVGRHYYSKPQDEAAVDTLAWDTTGAKVRALVITEDLSDDERFMVMNDHEKLAKSLGELGEFRSRRVVVHAAARHYGLPKSQLGRQMVVDFVGTGAEGAATYQRATYLEIFKCSLPEVYEAHEDALIEISKNPKSKPKGKLRNVDITAIYGHIKKGELETAREYWESEVMKRVTQTSTGSRSRDQKKLVGIVNSNEYHPLVNMPMCFAAGGPADQLDVSTSILTSLERAATAGDEKAWAAQMEGFAAFCKIARNTVSAFAEAINERK